MNHHNSNIFNSEFINIVPIPREVHMKKKFLLLFIVMYCVSPLIGMKQTSQKVHKKFKPRYIPGTLVSPVKGYPVKNIPYKQWDKNITIDGTLVKIPKVKGYPIKNSDFVRIKQEIEDIPEAEYTETPVSKKRTWGEYFRTIGNNFGFFRAKAQNTEKKFNQRVRKYSTQTNKSDKELSSFLRRELLIEKQQGGEKAVSTKYHQLAKQYHPDIRKDSGTAMKILNDAKEEVDKIDQKNINKYLNPQEQNSTKRSNQGSRRKDINDYYNINDIQDYLRWEAEYLKRKKEEEEEDVRSGTIIQEAPLNQEELKVHDNLLQYTNELERIYSIQWEKSANKSKDSYVQYPDPDSYNIKIADGTIMYINRCALYQDFINSKAYHGNESPSKGYARRIYRLQQQTLPKDFTNHILFKQKVYDRLVSGLAALYGRTRGNALIKDKKLFSDQKISQAENELEIENMIKDQLKNYEECVKACSYNGSPNIDSANILYTPNSHAKSKELWDNAKTGFINGYYNDKNNYFAAIYDLFCNEYIEGNIHKYNVEPTPYPFLLLKSYFDALENNSLPNDNPYSIKNLARDIIKYQKDKGYKVIKQSIWSKFTNLF